MGPKKAEPKFPYEFKKNGRTGRIKKWGDGKFGTYFRYGGQPRRNSFNSFEAALKYLDSEFRKLDTDQANSLSLNPLNGDVKDYRELELLLRKEGGGATLRDAVAFYLANYERQKVNPKCVKECTEAFLIEQKHRNLTGIHLKTLRKHLNRFNEEFGGKFIHKLTAAQIGGWLATRKDEKTDKLWSAKTRTSVRGSLVSLSRFSQKILKALPEGDTEFQNVSMPKLDEKGAVEIYLPAELEQLLGTAVEEDIELIPVIAIGSFLGLRPFEIHGEGMDKARLKWESFNWEDGILHVTGQKIRSKATRDVPLNTAVKAWLEPFKNLKGSVWNYRQSHSKRIIALRGKAGVRTIYDGFRHSYASYRIRQLKQDLPQLAAEMGNSPEEILSAYKRNVTDEQAAEWFSVLPPKDYMEKVRGALATIHAERGIQIQRYIHPARLASHRRTHKSKSSRL
ncbi:MAG TPA: hypothetical protein VIU12_24910 [Chryseolinea sp.]